jgi:CPA2 family monovalent cation:H+ antiporter-2
MESGSVLLEVGLLIFLLSLVARLAGALGISAMPLYVLAGLALGEGGLIPVVTATEFLEVGAEIGVVLLLLMLGVEYRADELVEGLRRTASRAAVDVVLNVGVGVAAGFILDLGWIGALALGGVTYASSSGIVAKAIDDLGWLANRETPWVLSLLVAEDLVMAALLPLLAVVLAGSVGFGIVGQLGLALGATAVVLVAAIRFGEQISRWLHTEHTEAMLLGALGLGLLVAGAAEQVQVSAAVGAFLVGIAISGPAQELSRNLLRPLRDLFAALFFTFFSLTINPADIPPVLVPAVVLAAITAATKYWPVSMGLKRIGVGERGRRRGGLLMIPRGEFSIVVAELGVATGAHARLGPLAATYVLVLALVAPVALRLAAPRPWRPRLIPLP